MGRKVMFEVIRAANRIQSSVAPERAARRLERLFLSPSGRPIRPGETACLQSARQTRIAFDGDRSIPVYSWGTGPAVILVHGWSGYGAQLSSFVQPLTERGFSVVAFDAPGHGAADAGLTGLPELAAAVERVAESVEDIHGLIAHSLGGAAVTVALSRGLVARRAVYVAPPDDPRRYLARSARALGFGSGVARRAQHLIEGRFGFTFESGRGTTLARSLELPLLVLHDERDRQVPCEEGARLAEAWPGARLMTTEGLGHGRILSDPEVVAAAVGFLTAGELQRSA